jgi:hypothetical protein
MPNTASSDLMCLPLASGVACSDRTIDLKWFLLVQYDGIRAMTKMFLLAAALRCNGRAPSGGRTPEFEVRPQVCMVLHLATRE